MTDRELMQQALEALEEINKLSVGENAICLPAEIDTAMDAIREALAEPEQKLDSALEALQNEMRETISKLDPNEMVWIHQPPGMPPILCKEPVVGAVPAYALSPALKITEKEISDICRTSCSPIHAVIKMMVKFNIQLADKNSSIQLWIKDEENE